MVVPPVRLDARHVCCCSGVACRNGTLSRGGCGACGMFWSSQEDLGVPWIVATGVAVSFALVLL